MSEERQERDWFKSAFSHDYIRIYAHRSPEEAHRNIQNLLKRITIRSDSRCLDLCCGFGRHLEFLRDLGHAVWGCDLSLDLLRYASVQAKPYVLQADMRQLPYATSSFDFVFSFFTSFGYFEDDAENARVIDEIARVLKPGGGLLMDFLNPSWVRAHLVPRDEQKLPEFQVRQERWIDEGSSTVNKKLTVMEDGDYRQYFERVKLYMQEDFERFFDRAGINVREVLGDADGAAWSTESRRMIFIGEKA